MAEEPQGHAPSTQADNADKTPVYEVGFHLAPAVGEEGIGPALDKIRAMLGEAEIIAEGFPQKMMLAYAIDLPAGRQGASAGKREAFTEAYFGWIKFAAGREAISPLQEKLRGQKDIIRSLVIETVREDTMSQPRRAVFTSDRLEGQTLEAPKREAEKGGEVSEAELEKSIEALTQ